MLFEWDPAKSTKNLRERGLPFDVAMAMFDGPTLETDDNRIDYGEKRTKAIGMINGVALVCIYVDRGAIRRIVSLRAANRKERHAYRTAYPGRS